MKKLDKIESLPKIVKNFSLELDETSVLKKQNKIKLLPINS
jgi:hypothetical protein